MVRENFGGRGPFNLPYSRVVRAGDFVFVSGQVGVGPDGKIVPGGVEAEAARTLERIAEALALADCKMSDVVKTTIYLSDANDFAKFNKVYSGFFPESPPARTSVAAPLVINAKVEIDVIAYRPRE